MYIVGVKDGKYIVVTLNNSKKAELLELSMNELKGIKRIKMRDNDITFNCTDDDIAQTVLSVYDEKLLRVSDAKIVYEFVHEGDLEVCVDLYFGEDANPKMIGLSIDPNID